MKTKALDRNEKLSPIISKFLTEHFKNEIDIVIVKYNPVKKSFIIKISYSKTIGIIGSLTTNFKINSRIRSVFNISNFKVEQISHLKYNNL
jgi:hypothetical protein